MIDEHRYTDEADNFYTRTVSRVVTGAIRRRWWLQNALDFDDLLLYVVKLFGNILLFWQNIKINSVIF